MGLGCPVGVGLESGSSSLPVGVSGWAPPLHTVFRSWLRHLPLLTIFSEPVLWKHSYGPWGHFMFSVSSWILLVFLLTVSQIILDSQPGKTLTF